MSIGEINTVSSKSHLNDMEEKACCRSNCQYRFFRPEPPSTVDTAPAMVYNGKWYIILGEAHPT